VQSGNNGVTEENWMEDEEVVCAYLMVYDCGIALWDRYLENYVQRGNDKMGFLGF
jgi:hypothetical protein